MSKQFNDAFRRALRPEPEPEESGRSPAPSGDTAIGRRRGRDRGPAAHHGAAVHE